MIELQGIHKKYGEKAVFSGFSCRFQEGKTTCLMGPSGCGKTTLLRMLLHLEEPDAGTISGLKGLRKSVVFQENRLCEGLGPVPNIRLVNPAVTRPEAEKMLCALGLKGSLRQPVHTFSGGMKRRVAILRALAAAYDVLILDEPFKGLDADTKLQTMDYLKKSAKGKTVIFVTHEESEAEFLGGEVLRL